MRKYQVDFWKKNQQFSQELLMFDLLDKAACTQYGQKYNFSTIQNYQDFTSQIPIVKYENIEPYISTMLKGESDILWPGIICHFSKSSGTTNDISKYIPVSHDSLYQNNYKAGRDVYSFFFENYPDSDLFKNKGSVLSLGGTFSMNEYGIKVGDVSAILMSEVPKWAENYREPSLPTALMKEWKDKIPAIIEDTKSKNITHLSGVPTWFISIFEELQRKSPFITLRDIWPNMELFIHGAVAFGPYRPIFEKLIPHDDMKYLEVYNASEGFFGIQDDPSRTGEMILLTDHGIFYEFIEMSDYNNNHLKTITITDVKVGINYAMIITTNAGLWRYDIGDTIEFTSTEPYRIKISGRTKHYINVFGEELMVGNTDQAVSMVSEKHAVQILEYTAGPVYMNSTGKGGHQWIVEFKQIPADINLFIEDLDNTLRALNSDYNAKRQDDIALQKLVLIPVPRGTFMRWMKKRGKLGAQNKVPRLSNKRKYIEEILALL